MTVEVCLTPELIHQFELKDKNVVIIDIFRATSCIVTGICNDVRRIYPVATVDECLAHGKGGKIMAGERGGQKIEAFDIGNSPYDYLSEMVRGRDVAVTTTNGTLAISKSQEAHQVIMGAFLNISATATHLLGLKRDVILHCAGWKGTVNLEDTLYAGAIIEHLGDAVQLINDSAYLSKSVFEKSKNELLGVALVSAHAQRLAGFGITRDIEFCMTLDKYHDVVVMKNEYLVKH